MTLQEKISQMMIVVPEQLGWSAEEGIQADKCRKILKDYPVGGVIFFAYHLLGPDYVKKMLRTLQEIAGEEGVAPLFLCIDEEGGNTVRLADNPHFNIPNVGPMCEITDEEGAFAAGSSIGEYLGELGFNVDFAPDADVITNPANRIIGSRSFGTDPGTVARLAGAYSDGLHSRGILSTYKHFPGHGATEGDTHEGYAFTNKTYEELRKAELVPFENAEEKKVDFVMMAHISLPAVLGDTTPCTLSPEIATDVLRKDLGYQGLIITDALNMGAIAHNYENGNACVRAVLAGNDILLMPIDMKETADAVRKAVEEGRIPEGMIDVAVGRILESKKRIKK